MAYCTVDDIRPYLIHFTIDDTSQPTEEEVVQMCDHVSDNLIDPHIRNYVDLPLTDSVGLNYCKQGAIWYVLAEVYRAQGGFDEKVERLELKFENFLTSIISNNALLVKPNNNMPSAKGTTRRDIKYNTDFTEDIW